MKIYKCDKCGKQLPKPEIAAVSVDGGEWTVVLHVNRVDPEEFDWHACDDCLNDMWHGNVAGERGKGPVR